MTEFLFNSKIDEKIKLDKVELLIDKFQAKNVYLTSYEATDKILHKYTNIDDMLVQYDFDKTNIGMFLFENFINYLTKNRKGSNIEKLKNLSQIYENFSFSDIIDYNIFINQKYDLTDYNGVIKCCNTSNVINNMKKYSFKILPNV